MSRHSAIRVLLVEDNPFNQKVACGMLELLGCRVSLAADGREALDMVRDAEFDMVFMDCQMPEMDGYEATRQIRLQEAADGSVPTAIIAMTANAMQQDMERCLAAGMDDYLSKPFDLEELCARARALRRRAQGRASPKLVRGDLVLDPAAHSVTLAGSPVALSAGEFTLLSLLLEHAGRVVPRERMEQTLYGWVKEVDSNTIEVYVHHLRKKLGSDLIRTVRGVGYRIGSSC